MRRFWSIANGKLSRRAVFKGVAGVLATVFAGKWVAERLESSAGAGAPHITNVASSSVASAVDYIDVRAFKKTVTVEQLNRTAEAYFASIENWDYQLAKPLSALEDVSQLLHNFAHVLQGLNPLRGMTVLDFGAGSCWASRWLTQIGMEVIALDVSTTALKIGEALYARLPVIGDRPSPRFLVFDGHRIDLADASVDRILCLDTLHHVLNREEVLLEMGRILKAGGIAGFSEPGPRHSSSPQSQFEMRNFGVLEDDINIREIWSAAKQAGFVRMQLAVFNPQATLLGVEEFDDYLNGGDANRRIAETTRAHMQDRRLFFLQKGGKAPAMDSRSRAGLNAQLEIKAVSTTVREGSLLMAHVMVKNAGRATWLPRSAKIGAVLLGCHLLDASGRMIATDFFRYPLTPGDGRSIAPGDALEFDIRVPTPSKGKYILEFDLVSESVGWFALNGSEVVRINLQIT